jgi:rhodanese-related sulfurtransferase
MNQKKRLTIKSIATVVVLLLGFPIQGQDNLKELLKGYNDQEVPYISVQELAMPKTNPIVLDAREFEEYQVSHLKNSIYVGYTDFNLEQTTQQLQDKQQPIAVYCSLGIRSEKIAKKLQKAGYTNVYNLYGGIFEWKNKGFSIVDSKGKETENVHVFSKAWGKWLLKGTKVYD